MYSKEAIQKSVREGRALKLLCNEAENFIAYLTNCGVVAEDNMSAQLRISRMKDAISLGKRVRKGEVISMEEAEDAFTGSI